MQKIKFILWDFNFLRNKPNLLYYALASFLAIVVIAIVVHGNSHGSSQPLTNYEAISYNLFFLILAFGILYNKKMWSVHFFASLVLSVAFSILRTCLLLLICLAISTLAMFLSVVLFQISPDSSNQAFKVVSNFIFYYPMVQVPLFFYQYKNIAIE